MSFQGSPKEAALLLHAEAVKSKVKFPKQMEEAKVLQVCGATIMLHRGGDGFVVNEALQSLIEKYGLIEDTVVTKEKKRKSAGDGEAEGDAKKIKKTDIVVNESNRSLAEAIKEFADIYFKQKDMRKGGVFSKAAKALREAEIHIKSGKDAMTLKGIGKGIATYVDEFITNNSIEKLEELRGMM